DGCPEPDNDLDVILDAAHACPTDAETPNGYQDEDGCPDQAPLSIAGDKILMVWPVDFVPYTPTLMKDGYDALDRLAAFLVDHPELTLIEIGAHTDDTWQGCAGPDRRRHFVPDFGGGLRRWCGGLWPPGALPRTPDQGALAPSPLRGFTPGLPGDVAAALQDRCWLGRGSGTSAGIPGRQRADAPGRPPSRWSADPG
ncbi:MAG: hypothetical protein JXB32_19320, partial [Deltaproteobacteria bacterium]|nr:hypothetical protein [Deltaproteobacteria bacterium]